MSRPLEGLVHQHVFYVNLNIFQHCVVLLYPKGGSIEKKLNNERLQCMIGVIDRSKTWRHMSVAIATSEFGTLDDTYTRNPFLMLEHSK